VVNCFNSRANPPQHRNPLTLSTLRAVHKIRSSQPRGSAPLSPTAPQSCGHESSLLEKRGTAFVEFASPVGDSVEATEFPPSITLLWSPYKTWSLPHCLWRLCACFGPEVFLWPGRLGRNVRKMVELLAVSLPFWPAGVRRALIGGRLQVSDMPCEFRGQVDRQIESHKAWIGPMSALAFGNN